MLASGGADQLVVLWDLDAAKPGQNLPLFDGMVQSLEWKPKEASILLSGTRNGCLRLDDGRLDEPAGIWNLGEVEVEKVLWDKSRTDFAYILTSDGGL